MSLCRIPLFVDPSRIVRRLLWFFLRGLGGRLAFRLRLFARAVRLLRPGSRFVHLLFIEDAAANVHNLVASSLFFFVVVTVSRSLFFKALWQFDVCDLRVVNGLVCVLILETEPGHVKCVILDILFAS